MTPQKQPFTFFFTSQIEQLDHATGLAFIQRYSSKMPFNGSPELRQLLIKAAALAASIFLSKNVKQPINTRQQCFTYLIILKDWLNLHKNDPNFNQLVHSILGLAISSQHLYYCSKIIEKGVSDLLSFMSNTGFDGISLSDW